MSTTPVSLLAVAAANIQASTRFPIVASRFQDDSKPREEGPLNATLTKASRVTLRSINDLAHLVTRFTYCAQTLKGDYRKKENFEETSLLVLDIDEGMSLVEAQNIVQVNSLAAVIAKTKSHQKPKKTSAACDRFRVALVLDKPITDQATYLATWLSANTLFNGALDQSCKDTSRLLFPAVQGLHFSQDGACFQVQAPQPKAVVLRPVSSVRGQATHGQSQVTALTTSQDYKIPEAWDFHGFMEMLPGDFRLDLSQTTQEVIRGNVFADGNRHEPLIRALTDLHLSLYTQEEAEEMLIPAMEASGAEDAEAEVTKQANSIYGYPPAIGDEDRQKPKAYFAFRQVQSFMSRVGIRDLAEGLERFITRGQELATQEFQAPGEEEALEECSVLSLDEMIRRFVYISTGKRVVDIQNRTRILKLDEFEALYMASQSWIPSGSFDKNGEQKERMEQTAVLWQKDPKRRVVDSITFNAGAGFVTRDPEGLKAVNLFTPWAERTDTGADIQPFLDHVQYLFGDQAEKFLDWLAHIEQRPGELPHAGWVHVSTSTGTGRGTLSKVLGKLWGRYAALGFDLEQTLRSGFNAPLAQKLLAVVDEIHAGQGGAWTFSEKLKSLVTEEFRTINIKNIREYQETNSCRWLIFSNHISALPMEDGDRRWNVCINEAAPRDIDYPALNSYLNQPEVIKAIGFFLANRDISGFRATAPAELTAHKQALIASSRSSMEDSLLEIVENWESDLIQPSVLAKLMGVDSNARLPKKLMERLGIVSLKKAFWVNSGAIKLVALRNAKAWESKTAAEAREEFLKVDSTIWQEDTPEHKLAEMIANRHAV